MIDLVFIDSRAARRSSCEKVESWYDWSGHTREIPTREVFPTLLLGVFQLLSGVSKSAFRSSGPEIATLSFSSCGILRVQNSSRAGAPVAAPGFVRTGSNS